MKKYILLFVLLTSQIAFSTDYYIDYINGDDGNNGLTTGAAFKNITTFTNSARSAGDRAFLRAGITWPQGTVASDITFASHGSIDAYISLIGCDATTNDPWGDANDVKPIIDFEDQAYQINNNEKGFWLLHRLDIRQSNDTNGQVYIRSATSSPALIKMTSCDISDGTGSGVEGIIVWQGVCTLEDCSFIDTYGNAVYVASTSTAIFKNCTFNHGAIRGSDSILIAGTAYLYDCVIGGTSTYTNAVYDFTYTAGRLYGRNNSYTYSGSFITYDNQCTQPVLAYLEDDDGVYGSHATYSKFGILTRETASPRSGGASSYAKMLPNANCGLLTNLVLGDITSGFAAKWLTKDVEYTATVYARTNGTVNGVWSSALTESEAYLKASYLSNASTAARTEIQSTETITNDGNWTAFTVTFTPLQTGFVYLWFNLAEYESADKWIDVDINPIVSQ